MYLVEKKKKIREERYKNEQKYVTIV